MLNTHAANIQWVNYANKESESSKVKVPFINFEKWINTVGADLEEMSNGNRNRQRKQGEMQKYN